MEPLLELAVFVAIRISAALATPIVVSAALGYISWRWLAIAFLVPGIAAGTHGVFFAASRHHEARAWAVYLGGWFGVLYLWPR